jgi:uncharacterized membrane protein YhaH (DUF805 family)
VLRSARHLSAGELLLDLVAVLVPQLKVGERRLRAGSVAARLCFLDRLPALVLFAVSAA